MELQNLKNKAVKFDNEVEEILERSTKLKKWSKKIIENMSEGLLKFLAINM